MPLAYICNPEDAQKIVSEPTSIGDVHFIRKNGERTYQAYRKVDMGGNSPFYVATSLPGFLYNSLIKSGKIDKLMYN